MFLISDMFSSRVEAGSSRSVPILVGTTYIWMLLVYLVPALEHKTIFDKDSEGRCSALG